MRKLFLQTIIVVLFLTACVNDAIVDTKSSQDTEKLVSFVVNVAGANPSKTRALTYKDENTVETVEVLLFDEAGKYIYQPIFSNDIVPKEPNEITFTMKIPEGTFNMVILANAREKVINILTKLTVGMPKAAVLNLLVTENSEKWNVTANSNGYQSIPMAGNIPSITVQGDNTFIEGAMLVRMLTKIDVDTDTEVRKKFSLSSVHLYNNNVKGKIAPDTDSWDTGYGRVVKPSIPVGAQNPNLGTALIYQGGEIQKGNNNVGVSCLNTIYTFESNKGVGDEGMSKNTCLVIGGKYDGDTKNTYYRIDFVSAKSNNKDYIALLRNYQYKVQITGVKGPGFSDPETAFQSRPVNIEASVIEWNDGDINDIVFDGQYLLGVSQSEFVFTNEQRTNNSSDNNLSIVTDYPGGWRVSKIVDEQGVAISWLKLSPMSGGTNKTVSSILLEENVQGTERVGYMHITAGRLSRTIKITQVVESDCYIKIFDKDNKNEISVLDFASVNGAPVAANEFNIYWKPSNSPLHYQRIAVDGGGIQWNSNGFETIDGSKSPLISQTGEKTYKLRPIDFTVSELNKDPFMQRSEMIAYSVVDGGRAASKSLLMRHVAKRIISIVDPSYRMNGEKHQFNVRSNMPFNISVKEDKKKVLKLLTTKGEENISSLGSPVYFQLTADLNESILKADVTLLLTSPTGEFEDQEVIIHCYTYTGIQVGPSNSYFTKPNGKNLLIPIARCNEWQKDAGSVNAVKLKDREPFTAHLVWTDNPNGMGENSTIKGIGVDGKGPNGRLIVEPGSQEGNAVIAIKNEAGIILWSWHIWVTYYSPTSGSGYAENDYMNRNLGAITNIANSFNERPKVYGLLYQWGRKDPFPSSAEPEKGTGYNAQKIYDAKGNEITAKYENIASSYRANNLLYAIMNPDIFYSNSSSAGSGDWFTTDRNKVNNNLWSRNTKTIYDPCPEGWRLPRDSWKGHVINEYNSIMKFASILQLRKTEKIYLGGFRDHATAKYRDEYKYGFYWTSNASSVNTAYMNQIEDVPSMMSGKTGEALRERATGAMIRCIREK